MQDERNDEGHATAQSERPLSHDAREAANSASHAFREEARSLKDEAKQSAQDAGQEAKQRAQAYAEEQRDVAGMGAAAVAAALRAGVDPLREQGQEAIANYWAAAADGADDFAERIKGKRAEELWHEAERYVREQPGVAFGGAMAVGFALSRFLKSSSAGTGYGGGLRAADTERAPSAGRSTASSFTGG